VRKYVEESETIDVTDLAAMGEGLAELIVFAAPEEERRASLLAHTIAHLGEMFCAEKRRHRRRYHALTKAPPRSSVVADPSAQE
jgi:hypothetical protein